MADSIIFVEGVPFTGKSTTSEYIAEQLGLNGKPAYWISEGMLFQDHFPLTLAMAEHERPFVTEEWRAEWDAFSAKAAAASETWVVDSAISYVGVLHLMNEDWPEAAIRAEIERIAVLCAPLSPKVIHMQGDVARLVPESIVDRGEPWREQLIRQSDDTPYQQNRGRTGLEGAITLMAESQDLIAQMLAQSGWPSLLTLDTSTPDWPGRRQAIMAFLDLNEVQVARPELTQAMVAAVLGTYASEDPDRAGRTLTVRLEHETLFLYGDQQRYGPLVPRSSTRFHLQASPLDIEFEVEADQAQRLILVRADGSRHSYRRT